MRSCPQKSPQGRAGPLGPPRPTGGTDTPTGAPRGRALALVTPVRHRPCKAGFSLIEVVVAVGLFALGMIATLGLFAPVASSISRSAESESAARVADSVLARLRAVPFDTLDTVYLQDADAVQKNDASGSYNPNNGTLHPAVIFAKLDGEAGLYDAARQNWTDSRGTTIANADKFFEIDLIRNTTLSPKAASPTATLLAFAVRIRWPAFRPAAGGTAVQVGSGGTGPVTFDRGRQQVLLLNASITR